MPRVPLPPLQAGSGERSSPTATRVGGDPWLLGICFARILLYANFMVYAACLPVVRIEWGMSAAQAGSIASGFMIGYAFSLVGFSWLADRIGAKRAVLLSALLSAVSAILFGLFAHSYVSALLLYTLAALCQGGIYTPVIVLFADRYEASRRGTAVGWLIASTSVGYAFSLVVTGAALASGGYRQAFIVTGVLPSFGAILIALTLRGTANRIHARTPGSGMGLILRTNANARRLVAGYTAHTWELLGMWSWMPAFLAASAALFGGAAVADAAERGAYLSALLHIVGAGAALSMGGLSDRLGRRAVLVALAALSAALSLTIGWLIALPLYLLILLGLVYSFAAIGDSPVLSTALTEVVEPGYLGAILGLRALLGFAAGAVSPLVFGWVLDLTNPGATTPGDWGWAFVTLGLGGLIATACAWGVRIRAPAQEGHPAKRDR